MATDGDLEHEQKQTLALFHVARQDITRALAITETALSMSDRMAKNDVMSWVFQVAAVVTYGRPFTKNEGIGKLKGEWTTFLGDEHLQDAHKKVMNQRHEVAAHVDLKWRPLFIAPAGTVTPTGIVLTEPKIISFQPNLEPVSYEALRLLCLHLLPRLDSAFNELWRNVFPDGPGNLPIRLLPPAKGEGEWINVEITRD